MTAPEDRRAHLLEFLQTLPSVRANRALERLDSLELLRVVVYLERTYGIRLAGQHIEPDDLRSVDGILGVIARSQG